MTQKLLDQAAHTVPEHTHGPNSYLFPPERSKWHWLCVAFSLSLSLNLSRIFSCTGHFPIGWGWLLCRCEDPERALIVQAPPKQRVERTEWIQSCWETPRPMTQALICCLNAHSYFPSVRVRPALFCSISPKPTSTDLEIITLEPFQPRANQQLLELVERTRRGVITMTRSLSLTQG